MEFIALTFNKLEMVLVNGLIAVLGQQASAVLDHRLGQRTKASSRKASVPPGRRLWEWVEPAHVQEAAVRGKPGLRFRLREWRLRVHEVTETRWQIQNDALPHVSRTHEQENRPRTEEKPASERESRSVVSDSLRLRGLYSLGNSPGRKSGVGSLSLLPGIFPTQELNPGLSHCRQILYQLGHQGSRLEWEQKRNSNSKEALTLKHTPGQTRCFFKSSCHVRINAKPLPAAGL